MHAFIPSISRRVPPPFSRLSSLSFSHSPFSSSRIDLLFYLPSILFSRSKRSRASVKCVRKSRSCLFRILREIVIEKFNVLALLTNICVQLYTSVCPPPSLPRKPLGRLEVLSTTRIPGTYSSSILPTISLRRFDQTRIESCLQSTLIESARESKRAGDENSFLPPSLDWIYYNSFPSLHHHTRLSSACPRVSSRAERCVSDEGTEDRR